ncbi:SIR2 family protein [Streptomyces sp. NPDC006393]|uniref:P-loop NTPase n=1 Tax=Streptomyces sp. NPDC006393 TaxID=3156763 RepID=UPI0033DD74C5
MSGSGVESVKEQRLVSRLRHELTEGTRKVAFITGSGVSLGAIPGVDGIVDHMSAIPSDFDDKLMFKRELKNRSGGDKYQAAAALLKDIRGQDGLNLAIRRAVLEACTGLGPQERFLLAEREDKDELKDAEYNTGLWKLTPAVESLGALLRALPEQRRGPVITTNFDPLLEIAVRKAGGVANPLPLEFDGSLQHREVEDAVNVVHVHGYWRLGDTLHTVGQLTEDRPELAGSLRSSLTDHTVVVVGYSGWEDAFSRSLLERVRERNLYGFDVIWCCYEALDDAVRASPLLAELRRPARWTFYDRVDAHRLFPRLYSAYQDTVQCPPGWIRIDRSFLDSVAADEHTAQDVERFFDGAEPGWATALDPRVPRLSVVGRLTGELNGCLDGRLDKRVVAAVGPMGEGKSIALRQAAVDLARGRDDVTVLWREHRTRIVPEAILSMPQRPGHRIVLVTDQGAQHIEELRRLLRACESAGRGDILVLLAGQQREWRARRAFEKLSAQTKVVTNLGLQDADGQLLVQAWEQLGVLRELARTPGHERATRLVALSRATYGRRDSSLVGAMLQLRYGPLLREHVGRLLDQLSAHPPVEGTSLVHCFLMIALLHVAFDQRRKNSSPLSARVLARVMGLEDEYLVEEAVVIPLGKEAALGGFDNGLWIRHHSIAEAALAISGERDPEELTGLATKLVTAAVDLSRETGSFSDDLHAAAYLSPGLARRHRQLGLVKESLAAGRSAIDAAPQRLSFRTAMMTSLRLTGRLDEALRLAEETCRELDSVTDPESEIAFVQEWGTAAGQARKYDMNTLLHGVALHKSRSARDAVGSLLSMGVPLTELHRASAEEVFLDALRAVVGLSARKITPNIFPGRHDAHGFLDNHRKYIEGHGATPLDGTEGWDAVQAAVNRLLPGAPGAIAPLLTKGALSAKPTPELR